MRSETFVLMLGLAAAMVLPACSGKHDPFFAEEPTFTVEVTAVPPTSLRDDETYGYWTYPATARFEGVPLMSAEREEMHFGETSVLGYDFQLEAEPAEETWTLMEGPMATGDDGDFVHEWHIDGFPDAPTAIAPVAGFMLYATIIDETPAPGESTVSLYSDMARTQLVAEGSGPDETEVILNEMNTSGISGEAHMEEVTGPNSSITLLFNMWMPNPPATGQTVHLAVNMGASASTNHENHNSAADIPTYHHVELSLIDPLNPTVPILDDEELEWVQTEHGLRLVGNFDLVGLPAGLYDFHIHVAPPTAARDDEALSKWLDEIEFEFEGVNWDGTQFTDTSLTLLNSPDDDMEANLSLSPSPRPLIDRGLLVSPTGSESVSVSLSLRDPTVAPWHKDLLPYGDVNVVIINEVTEARLETTLSAMYGAEHGFHFARNIALPLAGEVHDDGSGGGGHEH